MIDRRLRVLRVVHERGTVSAAAEVLGYTPSAVSHQLRTLARYVGARLLEPEGRGVRLTAAAQTLLARSDELFARWETIRAEVQQASGSTLGHLRLAGFSTAASALLAPVVARAQQLFPDSEVKIIEADPLVCFELLAADRVDVAVVVGTDPLPSAHDRRFEQQLLMVDSLDLLVPADHPLAERGSIELREAADERWLMDRPGSSYHQLTLSACTAAGFTPTQAHEVAEWDTCAALVTAGLGVALIPRLARLPYDEWLVRVPLRGDSAPRRHVRTSIRRGTGDQPKIALALAELRRVAATHGTVPPTYLQGELEV